MRVRPRTPIRAGWPRPASEWRRNIRPVDPLLRQGRLNAIESALDGQPSYRPSTPAAPQPLPRASQNSCDRWPQLPRRVAARQSPITDSRRSGVGGGRLMIVVW
jgi:hypothetical protein